MKKAKQAKKNQALIDERVRRRWSQQEVADLVGTTPVNVSRWERGVTTPTPYFRQQLSTLFGKSPQALGLLPQCSDPSDKATELLDQGASQTSLANDEKAQDVHSSFSTQEANTILPHTQDYSTFTHSTILEDLSLLECEEALSPSLEGSSQVQDTCFAFKDGQPPSQVLPDQEIYLNSKQGHGIQLSSGVLHQRRLCILLFITVCMLYLVLTYQNPITFLPPISSSSLSRGCYSMSCNGQLPEENGCLADKSLVSKVKIYKEHIHVATVEFYTSRTCAAGWVSIETPPGTRGNLSAEINNGGYVKQYCTPSCPVQRNYQPNAQSVHTAMIQTNQTYNIWGRGCYFPQSGPVLCYPDEDTPEHGFQGFWP